MTGKGVISIEENEVFRLTLRRRPITHTSARMDNDDGLNEF